MRAITISLPDRLADFVESQVSAGRYTNVSEYVQALIREDENCKTQEKLEALLLTGIQGGEATEMTRQDWNEIRTEAAGLWSAVRTKA